MTDFPELPAFLKRTKKNALVEPKRWSKRLVPLKPPPLPENIEAWSDLRLAAAMSEANVIDRQPLIREAARRERRAKALARIAEMKAKLAEKEND